MKIAKLICRIGFLLIILISTSLQGNAQSKKVNLPKRYYHDGTEYLDVIHELDQNLKIKKLEKGKKSSHFRIWYDHVMLDVWMNDNDSLEGNIYTFYWKLDKERLPEKTVRTELTFFYEVLTESESTEVKRVIENFTMDSLLQSCLNDPPQPLAWSIASVIEYSNEQNYFLHVKQEQPSDKDGGISKVLAFKDELYDLLDLEKRRIVTEKKLPNGCYENGESTLCKTSSGKGKVNRKLRNSN